MVSTDEPDTPPGVGQGYGGVAITAENRYRQLLRPIGAYLNFLQARYVTVAETSEGFLWHCYVKGNPLQPQGGLIAFAEVPALRDTLRQEARAKRGLFGLRRNVRSHRPAMRKHPLCPEGYEELLRSIGVKLDEHRATLALLVERQDRLVLRYVMPIPTFLRDDPGRLSGLSGFHEEEYQRQQVADLIVRMRNHRGNKYYR